MKLSKFYPEMKFTYKQFFSSWDEISTRLHLNTLFLLKTKDTTVMLTVLVNILVVNLELLPQNMHKPIKLAFA